MKPVNMNYEYLEIPGDLPIKERNYFKVVAKCGHVGKGYYFEGKFYVMAPTATRAAEKARKARELELLEQIAASLEVSK